ncbi:MAG: VWA domain-containing protein, partial [Gammaproteobacteria bacterium]
MARRRFDTFSLSFLDIMSCGFGAVILLFMVINATMAVRSDELNRKLSVMADALLAELSQGEENLVALRNSLADTEDREIQARGASRRIIELLEQKQQEIASMEADTLARRESINKLKADLQSLEESSKRLSAASSQPSEQGSALRRIRGQGDRQYLTGLKLDGQRVLILLDNSASMLDDTIVNIIRRRNMSDADKIRAPKWLRTQRTVEWLVARMSPGSNFQIMSFNETARPVAARAGWL